MEKHHGMGNDSRSISYTHTHPCVCYYLLILKLWCNIKIIIHYPSSDCYLVAYFGFKLHLYKK